MPKGANLVASLRRTLGPYASGCYGSTRMWQRLGTGDLGRAGSVAVILLIFLSFLLYSFVILHDLENYFFLLVTLRELIAVALHARQV